MQLVQAEKETVSKIVAISKRAFESDVLLGKPDEEFPPGYASIDWHEKMRKKGCLFQAIAEDTLVGGALLFFDKTKLYIGRIFVDEMYQRKGYGMALMTCAEQLYPNAGVAYLDTPAWNIRTNSFYKKLGYVEEKQENGFIFYKKILYK